MTKILNGKKQKKMSKNCNEINIRILIRNSKEIQKIGEDLVGK